MCIQCQFNSKKVCDYLINRIGLNFPKNNCYIPNNILNKSILLKSCIRGLFDTDGGLHKHHKYSTQLQFTNKSLPLIKSLRFGLIKLGYKPSNIGINHLEFNTFQLYLFNRDVKKYFREIGSNNPKNNIKFEEWINKGMMPSNSEIFGKTVNKKLFSGLGVQI